MNDLNKILKIIESKQTEIRLLKKELSNTTKELEIESKHLQDLDKIKIAILHVSEESKSEMIKYIEELVTSCLSSTFGNRYTFELSVNDKYGQQEITFFLNKNGLLLEPREDVCGDSVLNICSLGLRAATLILDGEAEPILNLDEPFKDLRYDKKKFVQNIIKHMSKDLNIQFNIITHDPSFIELADNLINLED
jgi:hypothetical protein